MSKKAKVKLKAGRLLGAAPLLGDIVYRSGDSLLRIQDAGEESYDVSKWTGSQWDFVDNVSVESARIRLRNSWEVYVRTVTQRPS